LTALTQPSPEDLRKEIRRCRQMTKNPFGVNLTLLPAMVPPDYAAYARVIIEEKINIVETAGNSPGPVIKQLKAAGTTILHKCTTIRHAQSAVKLGVDFLSIDGFECAGHVGETDITNFILLSKARQTLGVPFIASGGFADGQGLAAALALGACGINMGTRFMCTIEAPIHHNIKQAIVDAQETDTALVLRRWKNTSRLFANKVALQAVDVEKNSPTGKFEEVAEFVSGKRGRQVFLNGDKDFGVSALLNMFSCVRNLTISIGLDRWSSHWTHPRYSHERRTPQAHRARGRRDNEAEPRSLHRRRPRTCCSGEFDK
jgi:NAD(P)H-dependent flavin oxidoreductase YrpB (nitropropane dioxygenase family)